VWTITGIGLILAEIFTAGFVVAGFGLACLGAAAVSYWGFGGYVQIITFCIVTLIFFFGIRPFFVKFLYRFDDPKATNVQALAGRCGLVTEAIESDVQPGRIQLDGDSWRARSVSGGPVAEGQTVRVVKVEGVTAYVEPMP
jgi:membrane protein implicated in regulation of membrane protease activity